MRTVSLRPAVHWFVCANRRDPGSPLGPGCGAHGDAVFAAFKRMAMDRRVLSKVWITQTGCLGQCPRRGASVARYPRQELFTEVEPGRTSLPLFDDALRELAGS